MGAGLAGDQSQKSPCVPPRPWPPHLFCHLTILKLRETNSTGLAHPRALGLARESRSRCLSVGDPAWRTCGGNLLAVHNSPGLKDGRRGAKATEEGYRASRKPEALREQRGRLPGQAPEGEDGLSAPPSGEATGGTEAKTFLGSTSLSRSGGRQRN